MKTEELPGKEQLRSDICASLDAKQPVVLTFIDLDNFKTVNDTLGHQQGTVCLQKVAEVFASIIAHKGRAYRYGGDEFCALLLNFSREEARATAERIRREIESARSGATVHVTASIGVALSNDGLDDADALIEAADAAAKESKGWKNRVTIYEPPRSSLAPENQNAVEDLVSFVNRRLSHVSYTWLPSPVDIKMHLLQAEVPDRSVIRFGPPPHKDIEIIIKEILRETKQAASRADDYRKKLKTEGLWEHIADTRPNAATKHLSVFRQLRAMSSLGARKSDVLRDLLLASAPIAGSTRTGLWHNGPLLTLSAMAMAPEGNDEQLIMRQFTAHSTDYYTFRIIAKFAEHIREFSDLNLQQYLPDRLHDYLTGVDFQEFIHTLGVSVAIHTLKDNKLVIKQRSFVSTDDQNAGKFHVPTEGLKPSADIDDQYPDRTRDFIFIVNRCLEEELFGPQRRGRLNLIRQIERYYLTGVFLYLPNLSIDLCFLVRANCNVDEVRTASRDAKHAEFEFLGKSEFPDFTPQGIAEFIRATIGKGKANDAWDEGSLVTVLLSSRAMR